MEYWRGHFGGFPLISALQNPTDVDLLSSQLKSKNMRISVFRRAHFNAAHRLHNPNWSEEKNREVFGLCNNPSFHGHNYELEVKLTGEVDPETGYLIDLKILKDIIYEHIEQRFGDRSFAGHIGKTFMKLWPCIDETLQNSILITSILLTCVGDRIDEVSKERGNSLAHSNFW